jgi:hypothetical protein
MADRGSGWWPEDRPPRERKGGGGPEPDRGERPGPSGRKPPRARPPHGLGPRDRPKAVSRYSLFVGLAFAALAVVAILNAVQSDEGGVLGADPEGNRGQPIPEFAAPEAVSGPDLDANIAQDDCESGRNPCPADQVREPACRVQIEGAIRVCDLFDRPLAISFWFTRGGDCLPTQDAFAEVAAGRGREINFLSVNVLDDREDLARIVTERGWQLPVAHDADGAVSNIFGVGICPTIVLAYPGGIQHAAEIKPGNFSAAEIEDLLDELVAASAARGRR